MPSTNQRSSSQGDRRPCIIPLQTDYDESKIITIKHTKTETVNGSSETISIEVPKLPEESTSYQFLYFIRQFQVAADMMGWTDARLFQKFRLHLEGDFQETWDTIIQEYEQTADGFAQALSDFKGEQFTPDDYDVQMEYIRELKKPKEVSPRKFLQLLKIQEKIVKELPGAPDNGAGFTDHELRRIYLHAMPKSWQNKFEDADKTIQGTTLGEMRNYFEKQSMKDPFIPRNNSQHGNNSNKVNSSDIGGSNNRNHDRSDRRRVTQGQGHGNQRGSQNIRHQPIQNNDPCPLPGHGGHTWGQCRRNRYGNATSESNNSGQRRGHNYNTRNNPRNEANLNQAVTNNNSRPQRTRNNHSTQDEVHFLEESTQQAHDETESFFNVLDELEPEQFDIQPNINLELTRETVDLIPMALAVCKQVNEIQGNFLYKSLFDSGATHVMVKKSALPKNSEIFQDPNSISFTTTQGSFQPCGFVYLSQIAFPELSYSRKSRKSKHMYLTLIMSTMI